MTDQIEGVDKEALAKRNRRKLVLLFAIGFVPLFIAYGIFFYFPEWMPSTTTNEGVLIQPPLQAEEFGINTEVGKWALIVPVGSNCDDICQSRLYYSRQVHIALGKESERVHRILLAFDDITSWQAGVVAEYPALTIVETTGLLEDFNIDALATEQIFLMDPFGNIMMYYGLDKAGKPMLKDIKHLLKISNIG